MAAKAKRDHADTQKKARAGVRDLNRRDLRWQHKQTQKTFNRMRVLQELLWFKEMDLEPTCISCGSPKGNDSWCCGHFKTVGAQGGLRYDPRNTALQHNQRCNMRLSGDIAGTKTTHGYRQGIINRFGQAEGRARIDYCESRTSPVKWLCDQLEDMRKEFSAEIRRIEKLI